MDKFSINLELCINLGEKKNILRINNLSWKCDIKIFKNKLYRLIILQI